MQRVLRLRPGDGVVLLDNQGRAYEATIVAHRRADVELAIVRSWPAGGEPAIFLTLFQAVLKGEHFGWVLQKGTEVGISRFVPLICERNVVEDRRAIAGKRARWERIIQEAAEQCGRGRLPELADSQTFAEALLHRPSLPAQPAAERFSGTVGQLPGVFEMRSAGTEDATAVGHPVLRLIPWEAETSAGLHAALAGAALGPQTRIDLFIGPEGGWAPEEVFQARAQGVSPISLGPRILRAETAGIVAASAILYAAGDMEPDAPAGS